MSASKETLEGSCLCQKVRYRITGKVGPLTHCHCTNCRKAHGAAFASYLDVPRENLTFMSGEKDLVTYQAESGTKRAFCPDCGAVITCWGDDEPKVIEISAGTLDTPLGKTETHHIWVHSRVPWYEIRDDFPQHPKGSQS